MKALVTGASSGIGRDMALELGKRGYDLILVSRNKKELEKLKQKISTHTDIYIYDLTSTYNCMKLFNKIKGEDIQVVINNAGFGLCGAFEETHLDKELDMMDLNMKAVHILTKQFYQIFKKNNYGYILNVASSAAFLPGPLMATYYATKSYVLRLTEALYEELRVAKKNVYVGCLCPGPVDTNFNKVASVTFSSKPLSSSFVAHYAIQKMFQRKHIIIPGFMMKIVFILDHLLPHKLLMRFVYNFQRKKLYKD